MRQLFVAACTVCGLMMQFSSCHVHCRLLQNVAQENGVTGH